MTKQSFYKNEKEKQLRKVVDSFYNEEIGGRNNHYEDTGEMWAITEEELVDLIVELILTETKYFRLDYLDTLEVVEAKHIRFIGEKRIREIVAHRVAYRHEQDKKDIVSCWVWERA